jgi:hypothetical protein
LPQRYLLCLRKLAYKVAGERERNVIIKRWKGVESGFQRGFRI